MALAREKQRSFFGPGARQTGVLGLLLALALLFLPLLLLQEEPLYQREEATGAVSNEEASFPPRRAVPAAAKDRGRAVRLQTEGGEITELSMSDYLWGVVAAEMPASFQEEALKAQACAARTYTAVRLETGPEKAKHPGADICTDSRCCQAYVERSTAGARWGLNAQEYGEKITRAVAETDGLGILYEGRPIQALYFSSAAGKTTDAVEVWGRTVDYLKSVDSPEGEEVPNYHSQSVLTSEEVKTLTLAAYPGADLSGRPEGWFGDIRRSENGMVTSLTLGGITLTGSQARSLFSLRSAVFTVTQDKGSFIFDVTGYGHGVGMSQYGANAMAREGSSFRDILTWYYTGAEVAELW